MTIIKGREVTRPSTTPLGSSVLDHATVVSNAEHFGLSNQAGLWPSYNCMDTLVPTALCPDPTEDKVFGFAPWIPGFEFAVYGAVQCNLVGLDREDQKSEVERVFRLNEGKGVERALLANRFEDRAVDPTRPVQMQPEWDGAEDLTPAGVVIDVKVALALLEGYAATQYAGVPTIHMPRAAATLLAANGLIKWDNGLAYTASGSKVAVGGGYDQDTLPLTGTLDLYATGEVYVEQGAEVSISTYELTGSAESSALGLDSNTSVALVERTYRAAVDCFVAKATGTIWS